MKDDFGTPQWMNLGAKDLEQVIKSFPIPPPATVNQVLLWAVGVAAYVGVKLRMTESDFLEMVKGIFRVMEQQMPESVKADIVPGSMKVDILSDLAPGGDDPSFDKNKW